MSEYLNFSLEGKVALVQTAPRAGVLPCGHPVPPPWRCAAALTAGSAAYPWKKPIPA